MKNLMTFLLPLLLAGCGKKEGTTPDPVVIPNLTAESVTLGEGNNGTTLFDFTLRLSSAPKSQVSVTVATLDGFAKAGADYKKIDQQVVVFAAGETSKKVSVEVVADDIREGDDDFSIVLSNAVGCNLTFTSYKGFIMNDDTRVQVDENGYSTPKTYPNYTLAWADEFDGNGVNTADWNYDNGDGCPNLCGWGNNELQWYTQGENASVVNGKLIIEARKENRGTKSYTSTRMTTKGKRAFKFGRIDIRAKVPSGKGIWPALWMMPQENKFGNWPTSGEIDIMEIIGSEPTKLHATVHFGPGPGSRNITKSITSTTPYSESFNVYSLVWEQDRLRFYVNDVLFSDVTKNDLSGNTYPFNESFYFIVNVAVGGNWPGSPDASTYLPQWLILDYIRVFQ